MKQEALKFFSNTDLTAFASVLFAGAFVAILYSIFQKRNQDYYKHMSLLPLEKEGQDER